MTVGLSHCLALSAALFCVGSAGVLARRNILVVLMSVELMLNGANVAFLGAARHHGTMDGQVAALFVMALAAAEAAVGLALVVLLYRRSGETSLDAFRLLKG